MGTFNKKQLVKNLMDRPKNPVTQADMRRIVDGVFEEISNAVTNGESVRFLGFGTFSVRERKERTGFNPNTGKAMHVEAKMIPKFKPGKKFREKVNK